MSRLIGLGTKRLKILANQIAHKNWLIYRSVISFSDNNTETKDENSNQPSNESNNEDKDEKNSENTENEQDEKNSQDSDNVTDEDTIKEIDGPKGPEPTRYGDWEKGGRCYDF